MSVYNGHARKATMENNAAAILVAAALFIVSTVFGAPAAQAHDAVLSSNPSDGAVLNEFPRTVTLVFSGDPKPNFNTVAISDAKKKEVLYTAEPLLDNNVVSLNLPGDLNPGAGEYMIGFQITSSDGHSTRGKTSFTVASDHDSSSGKSADGTGVNRAQDNAEQESIPPWLLRGGIALLIVVVIVIGTVAVITRKGKQ